MTFNQPNRIDATIAVGVDSKVTQAANATLKRFNETLRETSTQEKIMQRAAASLNATTVSLFTDTGVPAFNNFLRESRAEMARLEAQAKNTGKAVEEIGDEDGKSSASLGRGGRIARASAAARLATPAVRIPGIGISTEQILNIGRVAGVFDKVSLGFNKSTIAAGSMTVALAGVVLAGKAFVQTVGAIDGVLSASLSARRQAAQDIATLSRQEIEASLEARRINLEGLQAQRDQAVRDSNQLQESVGNLAFNAADLFGVTALNAAADAVDTLNAQVAENETIIKAYTTALEQNAVTTADRVRHEQLRGDAINQQLRSLQFEESGNVEGQKSLVADLRREQELLTNLYPDQTDRISDLNQAINIHLTGLQKTEDQFKRNVAALGLVEDAAVVAERERLQALDKAANAQRNRAATELAEQNAKIALDKRRNIADALFNAEQKLLDLRERAVEVQESLAKRLASIQDSLSDALASARQKFGNAMEDLEAQLGERRIQIQETANRALLRIQRQFNRSNQNAIRDRDALAALEARETRKDEKAEVSADRKQEQAALERFNADRLRIIQRSYNQELTTATDRANKAIQIANQEAQERLNILSQERNEVVRIQQGFTNARLQMEQASQQQGLQNATTFATNLQTILGNAFRNILQDASTLGGSAGGGGGNINNAFDASLVDLMVEAGLVE